MGKIPWLTKVKESIWFAKNPKLENLWEKYSCLAFSIWILTSVDRKEFYIYPKRSNLIQFIILMKIKIYKIGNLKYELINIRVPFQFDYKVKRFLLPGSNIYKENFLRYIYIVYFPILIIPKDSFRIVLRVSGTPRI